MLLFRKKERLPGSVPSYIPSRFSAVDIRTAITDMRRDGLHTDVNLDGRTIAQIVDFAPTGVSRFGCCSARRDNAPMRILRGSMEPTRSCRWVAPRASDSPRIRLDITRALRHCAEIG
jgi:hypothetical protein